MILIGRGLDLGRREQGKGNREQEKRKRRLGTENETWDRESDLREEKRRMSKREAKRGHGRTERSESDLCGFEGAKPGASAGRKSGRRKPTDGVRKRGSEGREPCSFPVTIA